MDHVVGVGDHRDVSRGELDRGRAHALRELAFRIGRDHFVPLGHHVLCPTSRAEVRHNRPQVLLVDLGFEEPEYDLGLGDVVTDDFHATRVVRRIGRNVF